MANYIIEHYPAEGFPATGAYPVIPERPLATMKKDGVCWFAIPVVPGTTWELYHHDGRHGHSQRRLIGPDGSPGYVDQHGEFFSTRVGVIVVEAESALEALEAILNRRA